MRTLALVFCAWGLAAAAAVVAVHAQEPAREPWNTFGGSWSAIGRRQTLPTEGDRAAAIVQMSGTLVLTSPAAPAGPAGLSSAFRAEAIGFNDGDRLNAGRAVWTDTRGDRVFSVLTGERLATGRRITGTITGGTGRYAGLTGDWELTWQFVVETDEGEVQGRAADLRGRFRRAGTRP
jgi:hypothetical protein